jgi:hypothetical protein
VDAGVSSHQLIVDSLSHANNRVVMLDPERDGVSQITEFLGYEENVSAIHILSHGARASLALDDTRSARRQWGNTRAVKANNAVVMGGPNNFENLENIKLSSGANSLLFGNAYWGAGISGADIGTTLLQSIPLVDSVARNIQGKLTIDTSAVHRSQSPLVLDFRSVNHELNFTFSPIAGNPNAVMLTISTVRDLELPLAGIGPNIRNDVVVITHVDKDAIIYGGRYKNTFNLDHGAVYRGRLVGGEGFGPLITFPGRFTDKLLDGLSLIEATTFGLSLNDLISEAVFQVQNTISYSNPLHGFEVTKVNLQHLKTKGVKASPSEIRNQRLAGNIIGPWIDSRWTETTGLIGLAENTSDANLGDLIVRTGVNFVRGTDYSFDMPDAGGGILPVIVRLRSYFRRREAINQCNETLSHFLRG